jgi:hypothetical protein
MGVLVLPVRGNSAGIGIVAAFLIAITVASEDAVMRMLEKEFKGTGCKRPPSAPSGPGLHRSVAKPINGHLRNNET